MPNTWEYPWFAAWELAFHCIPLALLDPDFVKQQLILLGREWYQHPNGQIPAYEWTLPDVPPAAVLASLLAAVGFLFMQSGDAVLRPPYSRNESI